MKPVKALLVLALMATVGGGAYWLMVGRPTASPKPEIAITGPARLSAPAVVPESESAPVEVASSSAPAETVPVKIQKPAEAQPVAAPASKAKEPLQDPVARVALSLVGEDAEAEAYWLDAIADPSLPDQEREDLMEDLNETGFSADNGRRATLDDLPIVVRRLQLIEEIAPYANDFMNEHLAEAYKDLAGIHDQLVSQ